MTQFTKYYIWICIRIWVKYATYQTPRPFNSKIHRSVIAKWSTNCKYLPICSKTYILTNFIITSRNIRKWIYMCYWCACACAFVNGLQIGTLVKRVWIYVIYMVWMRFHTHLPLKWYHHLMSIVYRSFEMGILHERRLQLLTLTQNVSRDLKNGKISAKSKLKPIRPIRIMFMRVYTKCLVKILRSIRKWMW